MNSKSHICEFCSRSCEEAKQTVKKLNKRLYMLTIVCTSAITLLGEQGGKALLSSLNTVNSAMSIADGKLPSKENGEKKDPAKPDNKDHVLKGVWKPYKSSVFPEKPTDIVKKYEKTDELAMDPKKNPIENTSEIPTDIFSNPPAISVSRIADSPNTIELKSNANLPYFPDNFAVFFTPSLLPFDVYSTTLGLGNNYGFGDYYGIDAGSSVPSAGSVTVLAFGPLMNTRKRRI